MMDSISILNQNKNVVLYEALFLVRIMCAFFFRVMRVETGILRVVGERRTEETVHRTIFKNNPFTVAFYTFYLLSFEPQKLFIGKVLRIRVLVAKSHAWFSTKRRKSTDRTTVVSALTAVNSVYVADPFFVRTS